ncbi:bacteriocin family protein [Rhodococcus sp. BP-252]|uniref:Type 1 encapsulin shell protein n=1 Tax=Rhodococcoides kyotonense TaxID=398843 RepID=A0A177YKE1_9NOCA|nr:MULTISPECIES: family 1 encapsulin nanocompartment shell protein [Rhodococcus]MBY6410673.1 bacteriocin family protein [Rhodococcus sp. BP-320]MBY6415502.1 bacteriocin family protein [Rhodococcus sp. BP-321]MBY6420117.1 bacteriocin family protein [Rhodococcus sp. BP-324]MBY6425229.1 bacteriocin family protein [Rhodococcus sp. BP-323]MBY6430708.1 bacteriocin family protein [Rhodococcus sp. BP-322]
MSNLHRELAPISVSAWAEIDEEARRTFERNVAGRRVVDVEGPAGPTLAAVGTGHLRRIEPIFDGVFVHARETKPIVELRVPFTVSRQAVDDVERGASDSDWQPVKDAATLAAFAEDRAIFEGYAAADIIGLRVATANLELELPADIRGYPETVSRAITMLRLTGVNGPYSLVLGADAFTAINETSDHGYPISEHLRRVLDGDIVWAPAVPGAFLLSTRGGDFALHLGQDLSIGYSSHDAEKIELYFQESLTFTAYTSEAVVSLGAPSGR